MVFSIGAPFDPWGHDLNKLEFALYQKAFTYMGAFLAQ
jgi:hypothetical protein